MNLSKMISLRVEGVEAFTEGISLASNPYLGKSAFQKAAAWEHGWLAAYYKENAPEFKAQRERIGHNG